MQKHVVRCTQQKALPTLSSAVLKHWLKKENCTRRYKSDYFMVNERTDIIFQLCVKEALVVQTHNPYIQ